MTRDAVRERTIASAQWAAYADALGFITEFASPSIVRARTGSSRAERLVPWKRRVGGKFGVEVLLPSGCYSDDTQLRLSTSRAIRGDGHFDVEAFAKVELPVWLGYSLGGGRVTKAAASALARSDVNWNTNFFAGEAPYVNGGGNGAAMRVQPHAWAAVSVQQMAADVAANTITTHGHPRALVGAMFHALTVFHVLRESRFPDLSTLESLLADVGALISNTLRKEPFKDLWLPLWQNANAGTPFATALDKTVREMQHDLKALASAPTSASYAELAKRIDALEPDQRGSGTKSALLASFWASLGAERPVEKVITACNLLGSDTDTIGSMVGAIVGAATGTPPPELPMDCEYISFEAQRLASVASGEKSSSFQYPDLIHWEAPRTQADIIAKNSSNEILGLGKGEPSSDLFQDHRGRYAYRWYALRFGQHILAKVRLSGGHRNVADTKIEQTSMFPRRRDPEAESLDSVQVWQQQPAVDAGLHELTQHVIQSNFDPKMIGEMLLDLARRPNGIELCIAFSGILAKAIQARLPHRTRQGRG